MKRTAFALIILFAVATPITLTSCSSPPNERVAAIQTLKSVGQTAEAAVAASAQLFKDGKITAAQARQVMDFYDKRFLVSYRLAVDAAKSDLSGIATQDVIRIASELALMVSSFR